MNPGDIPNDSDTSIEEVTKFIDTFGIEANVNHLTYTDFLRTGPFLTVQRFLERPFLVSSKSWNKNTEAGNLFTMIPFPDALFTQNPLYAKLQNIFMIKSDIEITMRVNGTQMHYGRLLGGWLPQANNLSPAYTDFPTIGCTNFIQISATSQTDAKIMIPYHQYVNKQIVTGEKKNWFNFYVFVSSVLRNYDGADVASIGVSIFARFINIELAGYTYIDNKFGPQSDEASNLNSLGQVEDNSSTYDKIKTIASQIPKAMTAGENLISSGTIIGGAVSSLLGYSVPPLISSVTPAQIVMPRFMQYADNPHSLVVGTSQKDHVLVSKEHVMGSDGENYLINYLSRPCLLGSFDVTSEMTAGTVPVSLLVTPMNLIYQSSQYPPKPTAAVYPLPACYIGTMFKLWRGSMDFHLSVVCSRFHSLRIRVGWIPQRFKAELPDEYQAQNVVSTILDVTAEFEYSFKIPFLQETEWLEVGDIAPGSLTTTENLVRTTNGIMFIQIINELTSGASSDKVQPITFQIFAKAGDDFQFALPNFVDNKLVFRPQINEALTTDTLRAAKYDPIGGTSRSVRRDGINAQSSFLTFKQMLNMQCPFFIEEFKDNTSLNYVIDPIQSIPGSYVDTTIFFRLLSLFRYMRGSVRMIFVPFTSTYAYSYANYGTSGMDSFLTQLAPATFKNPPARAMSQALVWHSRSDIAPIDVVLPWNNKFDRTLISIGMKTEHDKSNYLTVSFPKMSGTLLISIGAGDDLSVGFLMPPPRCSLGSTDKVVTSTPAINVNARSVRNTQRDF